MDRRRFVITSASLGAVAAAVAAGCAKIGGSDVGAGLSSLLNPRAKNGAYKVTAQYATFTLGGRRVRLRTFGGAVPGPTVVTTPGGMVDFEIVNQLPPNPPAKVPTGPQRIPDIRTEEETMRPRPKRYKIKNGAVDPMNNPHDFNTTNLHTHGIQTTPHLFKPIGTLDPMAPMLSIKPGESFRYQLPVPDDHPSGLHWYHPHHHGATDVQASSGMAGLIVVRGPIDDVPEIKAARELFVVIQALKCNLSKENPNLYELEYKAYKTPEEGGYFVDSDYTVFTVATQSATSSGHAQAVAWVDNVAMTVEPFAPPQFPMRPGEVIRLRVLNGATQDVLPLTLPGMECWQIGFDGVNLLEPSLKNMSGDIRGLTPKNFVNAPVRMTVPGNRIEFLIKAPDTPGTYRFGSKRADDIHGPIADLGFVDFVVSGDKMDMGIPAKLPKPTREFPVIGEGKTPKTFVLSFQSDDKGETILTGFKFLVDGVLYDEMAVPTNVSIGEEVEWRIENSTGAIHPFHVHVNSFQLFAINDEYEKVPEVWDTFYVPPKSSRSDGKNGSITLRMRFLDFRGKSVFHCHFLSHEDTGMMQNFTIH